MTCRIIRNDDGTVIAIACGSPWGIGSYYHCHDAACWCEGESVYGFPPSEMNPEDFTPDPESCTTAEITAHLDALRAWREARSP